MRLKRRTREHVIADLSVNHVERFILQCGYSIVRTYGSDYGIDLLMYTHDSDGEKEPGEVKFQIKATDRLPLLRDGTISFPIVTSDLLSWARDDRPVILVVYDAFRDRGYWLDVRSWARSRSSTPADWRTKTVHVRMKQTDRFTRRAVRTLRELKNQAVYV